MSGASWKKTPERPYLEINVEKWHATTRSKTDIPKGDMTDFMLIATGAPTQIAVTNTESGGRSGRMTLHIRGKNLYTQVNVVSVLPTLTCVYRFFPRMCNAIRPLLPPLSVFVTAICVGAPVAINIKSVMSPLGISVLLLVLHAISQH
ncbi:unnamed protein product [Fraxinus pennsylvanica]|uniref:Uncharacterized protein n=1 Tax=Fraxinus pennsylvanica TaxID=56036 RepID=A0AAD1ZNG5_9LAMI|nr:unnamed protein product [Fraxinus pennsylvanica]